MYFPSRGEEDYSVIDFISCLSLVSNWVAHFSTLPVIVHTLVNEGHFQVIKATSDWSVPLYSIR